MLYVLIIALASRNVNTFCVEIFDIFKILLIFKISSKCVEICGIIFIIYELHLRGCKQGTVRSIDHMAVIRDLLVIVQIFGILL